MADFFVGVNRGERTSSITSNTSTTSKDIELRFTTSATLLTKKDVILALEQFEEYLLTVQNNLSFPLDLK